MRLVHAALSKRSFRVGASKTTGFDMNDSLVHKKNTIELSFDSIWDFAIRSAYYQDGKLVHEFCTSFYEMCLRETTDGNLDRMFVDICTSCEEGKSGDDVPFSIVGLEENDVDALRVLSSTTLSTRAGRWQYTKEHARNVSELNDHVLKITNERRKRYVADLNALRMRSIQLQKEMDILNTEFKRFESASHQDLISSLSNEIKHGCVSKLRSGITEGANRCNKHVFSDRGVLGCPMCMHPVGARIKSELSNSLSNICEGSEA